VVTMNVIEVFLAGVVVGLAASWTYILSLKATLRVCMRYIQERIHDCTNGLEGTDGRIREERQTKGMEAPTRLGDRSATSSPPEGPQMADKPLLIIESSGKGSPIHYQCSRCLRVFRLAEIDSPKAAAAELFRRFRQHVAQEHA